MHGDIKERVGSPICSTAHNEVSSNTRPLRRAFHSPPLKAATHAPARTHPNAQTSAVLEGLRCHVHGETRQRRSLRRGFPHSMVSGPRSGRPFSFEVRPPLNCAERPALRRALINISAATAFKVAGDCDCACVRRGAATVLHRVSQPVAMSRCFACARNW